MLPSVGGGSGKTVTAARPRSGLNIGGPPPKAGSIPQARSGLAAAGTPPRPTRKPAVSDIVKGSPESITWQSSASIGGGGGVAVHAKATSGHELPQHSDGRPPKPGAATPEPAVGGHSPPPRPEVVKASTPGPRGSSRGGARMSLRRARLDTPAVSLVDAASPGRHTAVVPHYRVDDLDGAWDVGKPGALAKWPAQKGSQPSLVPADGRRSRQGAVMATEGSGQILPALDASAPASSFLAHVTKHLAFELRHVPANEGTAGRLKVAREAFDMLIEGFPSYGPVLATVQAHYEARVDALEDDMARYQAAERTVQEERERAIAAQDASKNEVALAKAEADGERRRAAAAEHKSSEDDARLRRRIDQLEGDLEDARRDAAQERAARREADSNTDTYRAMYNLLKSQWDSAKAEVTQFRAEASEAVGALERDKRVAEGALANAEKKFSAERQELAAQLEAVKAASLTTEQAEQMHEDSAKLREVLKRLQAKLDWTTREMERRKQFEVPVQWAAFERPELMRLKDAGVDSHTIVMRVLHDHDRAVAAEKALRARLHALSGVASAVESGPLVACLPPAPGAKAKRHPAAGMSDDDGTIVDVAPLTAEADPWAPKSWLNCDVSPHGPLSTLPPSVHQHRAVRQWACAALFASAATGQPDLGAAFEKSCGEHCDFRTVSPFFTAVVFRLRTTFAGDPLLSFFVSLLTRRRCAIAHAHQLVLAVRCALRAWEHVDRALAGRVTGRLPRDALLGAFASAFPLKTAVQLLALRQAVFEHLDGTMSAGGFVGPDGSIHVNAPPPATANDPELTAKADAAEKASSSSLSSGGDGSDAVGAQDKPIISGFDAFSEADSDAPPPTKVLKPTPWHAIASIAYTELFGPSDLTASGRASPVLVELCVQYEQDVARGEGALEARLSAASDGVGRFERGIPEVRTFLGAWALHRRFAAELVLGAPSTLAGEEEVDPSDGEACAMPPVPSAGADAESPAAPSKSMHRSSRSLSRSISRSFGGTALERALRGLSAAVPHGGILAPERFASVITAALGADVAGSQAARLLPSPTTGAMPVALGMRLIPDAASAGPEAAAARAVLRPVAGQTAGNDEAEPAESRPPSEKPVTARDVVEAACRLLPVSGTFLVRCAAKSYMVPPAVFHSFADAYTSGIDLASALHYDVARGGKAPAPAPAAASPTKGGPASPNKTRR